MAPPDVAERINGRLRDLYERQLLLEAGSAVRYYASGREYYGPELAGEERDRFAIVLASPEGDVYAAGDADTAFALQSMSKVFVYALALRDHGRDHVLEHVGVEPSGDAFNSIVFDEPHRRPFNLGALRAYAGNPRLEVDWDVFERELGTADRNRATAYLMRSNGMLSGDVEAILAVYLQQCSVNVTCRDLAVMAATLANGCVNPLTGERVLPRGHVRDVLSVMHTCGMYDAAGQWAFDVGVPAKSGVSGGILAAVPGKMGIAVYSPGLDEHGNSVRGVRVCEEVSGRLGLHTFATEGEDAMVAAGTPA